MPSLTIILRETDDGRVVKGALLFAFHNNGGTYFFLPVHIYQDGLIDCLGLVDFEGFKRQVTRREICTSLPEGASVSILPLALFTAVNINLASDLGTDHFFGVAEDEFLKEVLDEIERLNQRPMTGHICREMYRQWRQSPTE